MSTPPGAPAVHVLLPGGVDDPARPSGGNVYDRRVCDGLAATGWGVRALLVPGSWPRPGIGALAGLAALLATLPGRALVLVDGLIASAAAAVLVPETARLRVVVLVHMPLPDGIPAEDGERAVLAGARAVITTSGWTRDRLLERYPLPPERVRVARPGVDPAARVRGSVPGDRLLCVAAVVPHKGQDLLLGALAGLTDRPWRCTLVGSLDADPAFAGRLRREAAATGLDGRVRFTGPRTGPALRREYQAADVLVLPSRIEAYGMVVTEALAAGIPVIAAAVGGVREAMGSTPSGLPGLLVPPGSAWALRAAIARWLGDARLRRRLRGAAVYRRGELAGWETTGRTVAGVLHDVAGEPVVPVARVPLRRDVEEVGG